MWWSPCKIGSCPPVNQGIDWDRPGDSLDIDIVIWVIKFTNKKIVSTRSCINFSKKNNHLKQFYLRCPKIRHPYTTDILCFFFCHLHLAWNPEADLDDLGPTSGFRPFHREPLQTEMTRGPERSKRSECSICPLKKRFQQGMETLNWITLDRDLIWFLGKYAAHQAWLGNFCWSKGFSDLWQSLWCEGPRRDGLDFDTFYSIVVPFWAPTEKAASRDTQKKFLWLMTGDR